MLKNYKKRVRNEHIQSQEQEGNERERERIQFSRSLEEEASHLILLFCVCFRKWWDECAVRSEAGDAEHFRWFTLRHFITVSYHTTMPYEHINLLLRISLISHDVCACIIDGNCVLCRRYNGNVEWKGEAQGVEKKKCLASKHKRRTWWIYIFFPSTCFESII